jgi:hypothetical protein
MSASDAKSTSTSGYSRIIDSYTCGNISRRAVFKAFTVAGLSSASAITALRAIPAAAQTQPDPLTQIKLELPRDVLKAEMALAGPQYSFAEPTELRPDPDSMEANFIDPVSVIVVLTIAVLAERMLHYILTSNGQGVLVDTRDRPPRVSFLAGVPQGFVVIVKADGTTETVRADLTKDELSALLGGALKATA